MANSRLGNLIVPNDVEVLYVEPAVLYKVKDVPVDAKDEGKPVFYLGDPKSTTGLEVLTKEIQYDSSNKENQILARDYYEIDPNQPGKFILRPEIKHVALYKRKAKGNPNLPESGNEIEIVDIGFMYAKDLEPVEKFKPSKKALFDKKPSVEQVKQSWMGNCFFLASIMAIAKTQSDGLNFIKNMMRQQADGSVIVRLYHPTTLQPVYVKVEGSEHYKFDELAHQHGAYWIHILEKAYAGFAYNIQQGNVTLEYPSFLSMYGSGGRPEFALTILTGKPAIDVKLQKTPEDAFNPFTSSNLFIALHPIHKILNNQLLAETNEAWNDLLKNQSNNLSTAEEEEIKNIKQTTFDNMFNLASNLINENDLLEISQDEEPNSIVEMLANNKELYKQWAVYTFVLQHSDIQKYMEFNEKVSSLASNKKDLINYLTIEMRTFEPKPPTEVLDQFVQHIQSSTVEVQQTFTVDSQAGSGEYSKESLKIFKDLQKCLQENRLLTASTPARFEGEGAGLRNTHAYTITDVKEQVVDGKKICWVTVRNPWGNVGRLYDEKWMPFEDQHSAESRLDLCDFVKLFESYSVGSLPTALELDAQLDRIQSAIEVKETLLLNQPATELDSVKRLHIIASVIQHPAKLMKFLVTQRTLNVEENSVANLVQFLVEETELTDNPDKIELYTHYAKMLEKTDKLITELNKQTPINFNNINYIEIAENHIIKQFCESDSVTHHDLSHVPYNRAIFNLSKNLYASIYKLENDYLANHSDLIANILQETNSLMLGLKNQTEVSLDSFLKLIDKLDPNDGIQNNFKTQIEKLLLEVTTSNLKTLTTPNTKTSSENEKQMQEAGRRVLSEVRSKNSTHLDRRTKIETLNRTSQLIKNPNTYDEYKKFIMDLPKLPILRRVKRAMEGLLRMAVNAFTVGVLKTTTMPYSVAGIHGIFSNPLKRKMRSLAKQLKKESEVVNNGPKKN